MEKSKKTFWVVSKEYEDYLKTTAAASTSSKAKKKFQEDWQFLINMKKHDRPGSIGPFDKELASYGKRIKKRKFKYISKCTPATSSQTADASFDISSSGSSEETESDPTFESPKEKKCKSANLVINITNDTFKKATLTADVSGLSVRKQLQYTAALINAGGGDINDVSLSKTTIQRNKQTARTEMLSKIQNEHQELWQNEDSFWALHWDGKTLKQTTHTESKKSVLAVVLKEIYTDFEILVDVMDMANGTGSEAEATKIMKALEKMKMQISKIVACSFDTTATNSGLNKGVVVQVQEALHHPVFQMACRHHILELVCGAICKNAFGSKTESPTEPLFKRFAEIWCSIDTSTYFSYVFKSRKLQRIKDDVLKFLWNWIQNGKTARGDYLELVELRRRRRTIYLLLKHVQNMYIIT